MILVVVEVEELEVKMEEEEKMFVVDCRKMEEEMLFVGRWRETTEKEEEVPAVSFPGISPPP